jgi:hypothetical protein
VLKTIACIVLKVLLEEHIQFHNNFFEALTTYVGGNVIGKEIEICRWVQVGKGNKIVLK